MKSYIKAIFFLILLTALDFLLRQGLIGSFLPLPPLPELTGLLLYSAFAGLAWLLTKKFANSDQLSLADLGIAFNAKNRSDFFIGFMIGLGVWAIVSLIQSYTAGFSWELRPNISLYNLLYGLLIIFIADLGTELFTRGYPLSSFRDSFGANKAILIMTLFVALKSFSFGLSGELLLYTILIPALHTIFFSIIYFKTKNLGAAVGVHTGANFVTISIFDLRPEQAGLTIPSGIFRANAELESLSLTALQLPWVLIAGLFSIVVYYWWKKE